MVELSLEEIIGELLQLARRKPLSREDLARARRLMNRLRELGFTNREVAELTGGGWSEPTVKLYTRGSRVRDPAPKNNALKLLTMLVDRGLSLADVERALKVVDRLENSGISVEEVSTLLETLKRNGISLDELLNTYKLFRRLRLTIEDVKEISKFKVDLEALNFTVENVSKLLEVAESYGGFKEVMDALKQYGSLTEIRRKIDGLIAERERLIKTLDELKKNVEDLERRRKEIESTLMLYRRLVEDGFKHEVLLEIKTLSERFGGVDGVFKALKLYGDLEDLNGRLKNIRDEKSRVEAEFKRLKAEYAYLQATIALVEKLLYEYHLGLDAVEHLYKLTENLGGLSNVIRAIQNYGSIENLRSDIERLEGEKVKLESKIKELERRSKSLVSTINEQEAHIINDITNLAKTLSNSYKESVKIIENEVAEASRKVGMLEEKVERLKSLSNLLDLIEKPSRVEASINEVMSQALSYLNGLKLYVTLNKNKIGNAERIKNELDRLLREIIGCVKE